MNVKIGPRPKRKDSDWGSTWRRSSGVWRREQQGWWETASFRVCRLLCHRNSVSEDWCTINISDSVDCVFHVTAPHYSVLCTYGSLSMHQTSSWDFVQWSSGSRIAQKPCCVQPPPQSSPTQFIGNILLSDRHLLVVANSFYSASSMHAMNLLLLKLVIYIYYFFCKMNVNPR